MGLLGIFASTTMLLTALDTSPACNKHKRNTRVRVFGWP